VRIYHNFNSASDPAPSFFISEIEYITLQKVADIEISGIYIHKFMIQYNMNPQILATFEKMRKNAIIGLYAGEQAAQQLHDIEAVKKARETQSK
jgi:hypothetical protein